mmetsp:Transcript_21317/g.66866  ORF Transcript_21317/g.66866 Transcript_21317/m.66866 type:complete len:100 (+) Transcript_21317:1699-1998(+)
MRTSSACCYAAFPPLPSHSLPAHSRERTSSPSMLLPATSPAHPEVAWTLPELRAGRTFDDVSPSFCGRRVLRGTLVRPACFSLPSLQRLPLSAASRSTS